MSPLRIDGDILGPCTDGANLGSARRLQALPLGPKRMDIADLGEGLTCVEAHGPACGLGVTDYAPAINRGE